MLSLQVELAALEYRSSRLVRVLDAATGQRLGFGEGGATEVVSARCACQRSMTVRRRVHKADVGFANSSAPLA